ncbi:MAG TPA: hypothetical protein VNO70_12025 [Blastocatellia bacterium]|nr:hypothetical protein [Blastocatellia bacterium]
MRRYLPVLAVFFLTLTLAQEARSQLRDGNLAIKTNGNVFQAGDQLKVELLALEAITEPFFTQVSYKFTETVKVKDESGSESTKEEERTRSRQPGPVLESLDKFRSLVLDDTFHFGEGSLTGRYTVEVAVFRAYTRERVAMLRSCVFYQEADRQGRACPTYLRGLKRAESEVWWTFEGSFAEQGRYSAVLFNGGKVVAFIEVGVYASGPQELSISSDALSGTAGRTLDILIHDHKGNTSSTLARVTIPSAN